MVDNIIIGTIVKGLTEESLGIDPSEDTIRISAERAKELNNHLPRLLVEVGVYTSTSEIKRIDQQRRQSTKIKDPRSKKLWRELDGCEMTHFKIGKKVFWLIVGEDIGDES